MPEEEVCFAGSPGEEVFEVAVVAREFLAGEGGVGLHFSADGETACAGEGYGAEGAGFIGAYCCGCEG